MPVYAPCNFDLPAPDFGSCPRSLSLALCNTALPGQRRAARRARARARLSFHLHQRGLCILDLRGLRRIWHTLNQHHSRDPAFLFRRIAFAMASMKRPAWKCSTCRRMVKGNDVHCPQCGGHWEDCMDRDHQEAPQRYQTPTRHTTYRGHGQDDRWDPQYRQSQSPRHRQRPNSRRHGGKGNRQQNKGSGKGPPQQFQQDNSHGQKGGKNPHGLGREGMAPLPPPPLPSQATMTETGWMNLHPPFPSLDHTLNGNACPAFSCRDQADEDDGHPEEERDRAAPGGCKDRQGHFDHRGLGQDPEHARRCGEPWQGAAVVRTGMFLPELRTSRLGDSSFIFRFQRWQEYTLQFQAQEKHNLEQISQARDAVKNAQTIFKANARERSDHHRGRRRSSFDGRGTCSYQDGELHQNPEWLGAHDPISRDLCQPSRSGICRRAAIEEASTEGRTSRRWLGSRTTWFAICGASCFDAFWKGSQWMTSLYPLWAASGLELSLRPWTRLETHCA